MRFTRASHDLHILLPIVPDSRQETKGSKQVTEAPTGSQRNDPPSPKLRLSSFDAVIFDLDGVITRTAEVHAQAWKRLFDEFLRARAEARSEPFRPFDDNDYLSYVDGKPRFDGVNSFLKSRGIDLPWGELEDGEDEESVCGLGNRKNRYFREHLEREGVEAFESSVRLLHTLRDGKVKTGLASSSRNSRAVLEAAGLTDLFEIRVDGNDLAELGLNGKPAPDLFLLAADRLGVDPSRAVVVEDAISGVEAGRAGDFVHVIGVDRGVGPEGLREGGADIVVSDLEELVLEE